MVLLEAMACHLPVIAFDCPSGTREIVRHEVDGLLVPPKNINSLAEAMSRLMENELLRNQLAQRAGEVVQRFSAAKVMGQWEELLARIIPYADWQGLEQSAPRDRESAAKSIGGAGLSGGCNNEL